MRRMREYFQPDLVNLLAYCLMLNHFHMAVYVKCQEFGRQVMHPFSVSITRSINRDMNRVGPLFQGPYQAKRVNTTEQLVHLTKYIHRNPVEAKLVQLPEKWQYSSYQDYIALRNGSLPVIDFQLLGFQSQTEYRDYVNMPMDERKIQALTFKEQ